MNLFIEKVLKRSAAARIFGNAIRILVPLVATDAQIEEGLVVLEQALAEGAG